MDLVLSHSGIANPERIMKFTVILYKDQGPLLLTLVCIGLPLPAPLLKHSLQD